MKSDSRANDSYDPIIFSESKTYKTNTEVWYRANDSYDPILFSESKIYNMNTEVWLIPKLMTLMIQFVLVNQKHTTHTPKSELVVFFVNQNVQSKHWSLNQEPIMLILVILSVFSFSESKTYNTNTEAMNWF